MARPDWCPITVKFVLDHLIGLSLEELPCEHKCVECLKNQTENFIERTAIKTSLKEPVADLIRAMIDDEFPEDERHA